MAASLSLHHIPVMDAKQALYSRAFEALRSGGVFVNADCTMPREPVARDEMYSLWVDHMAVHDIEEADARRHFEDWSEEDTYMPLEDELAALAGVGFEARCVWREGPMSVIVGTTPA